MKKFGLSLFALSLATGLCPLSSLHAETLNEALVKAYNTNPDLAAAQAGLRAVDEQAPQALSGYRPSLGINSSAGYSSSNSDYMNAQDYTSTGVSLELNQPLYRGGRTAAAVRQADSTIAAQQAALQQTEQQVLLQAIQAYFGVLRDEAIVGLTRDNERVLTKQLKASKDRFAVGEITRTDVSQSEARLSGAVAQRVEAEGALVGSQAAYQRYFGEAPNGLVRPDASSPPLDLPINLDEAITAAINNNPSLIAAMHSRDAAAAALDGAKGERLPTLTATGSLSHSDINGDYYAEGKTDSASAMLTLNIPLYQSGATSSRIRAARQGMAQSNFQRDSAERQAVEQVTSAWQNLSTARASKQSRTAQVEAARVALDGVKQEADVGSRSVLDTLNAEQEYLEARIGLVQADFAESLAQYAVLASIGQLTAKDLQLAVELYDADAYANEVRGAWLGSDIGE